MLPTFSIAGLVLPSALIFVVTALVALRVTRSALLAFGLATIKCGTFFIYYGYVFDGTFTFFDDWTYLRLGEVLVDQDIHWLNLFDNLDTVFSISGGEHIVYMLYNASAIRLFGHGYFAPVALNIAATVLVAWWGTRLAVAERWCPPPLAAALFCFLLLHPDLLAWSIVMNGKDVLVLLLHVVLLWAAASYYRGRRLVALILAAVATLALFYLRFYVPFLFALSFALVAIFQARGWSRLRVSVLAATLLGGAMFWIGGEVIGFSLHQIGNNLVDPAYGLVRFLLTPIPFHTERAYEFLDLPAVLHWILLPFACLGLWRIGHMRTPFVRFFVVYVAVFVALYAVYAELQEPRHRVQLDYALAICQFVGLWQVLRLRGLDEDAELKLATGPPLRPSAPPSYPTAKPFG